MKEIEGREDKRVEEEREDKGRGVKREKEEEIEVGMEVEIGKRKMWGDEKEEKKE